MLALPELHVGRGIGAEVTIFPIWCAGPPVSGLSGGSHELTVTELDTGPSVEALTVANTGRRSTLLVEGQLLEGGWQNRAVAHDLILAPHSQQVVEVACVEEGRWGGQADHARLSRRTTPRVQVALRSGGSVRQDAVWSDVRRYEQFGGATPTMSLSEHLDRLPAVPVIRPLSGQRGVLFGVGGQPLVLELFGSPKALAAQLPGLIQAVYLEAVTLQGQSLPVPGRRARRMVTRLSQAGIDRTTSPRAGSGVAIGFDTHHLTARGVATRGGHIAHLSVLNRHHPLFAVSA